MKFSPIVVFALPLYLISCESSEKDFKGLWKIEAENEIGYVEINDSIINFRFSVSECDSTLKTYESVMYEIETGSSADVKLGFEFEGKPVKSEFEMINENSAVWVWASPESEDSIFVSAVRTNFKFTEDIPEMERRLGGYQSFVYEHADSLSQLSKRLAKKAELSEEAADVVNYIDSLRHRLLDPLKEEYSSVKCAFADWKLNKNSRASDTLIGEIPYRPKMKGLSAHRLKHKLEIYSGTLTKEVLDVFPDFAQSRFNGQIYYEKNPIHWETFHFYNVPMGLTILKLNEFELKIYRIEQLKKLLESS